ncbi:MAG: hypothetical protein Q9187_006985 [Circinaria calcarea]
MPELQETSNLPCDTGSSREVLEREFGDKPVDFSLVHDDWNSNQGKFLPHAVAVEKRAEEVRQWLKARPEKEIVIVTHGGFLHYFTGDWSDSARFEGTGWSNTEFRSYQFSDETGDDTSLVETKASRDGRRGTEKPLSKTEQMELRETTNKSWENNGYVQSKV